VKIHALFDLTGAIREADATPGTQHESLILTSLLADIDNLDACVVNPGTSPAGTSASSPTGAAPHISSPRGTAPSDPRDADRGEIWWTSSGGTLASSTASTASAR